MKKLFLLLGLLVLPSLAQAQTGAQVVNTCATLPIAYTAGSTRVLTQDVTGQLCTAAVVSASITFPTIGAAVPATGIYNAINVAGTLRGWSGLSTGAIFPGTVAVVDASGNQVTSFGGTNASVSATGAAVPASATYMGINTGGNIVGWTGAVTVASGGIASGAIASGAVASGAVASGAIASGAVASGAYASGSIGSGAMVDLGAIADAASSAGGTGSVNAKLRLVTTQLDTLNTNVTAPVPNPNSAAAWGLGTTGAAVPASANYIGAMSSTLLTGIIQADISTRINISTATTTEIVGAVTSQKVYITAWDVVAAGTGNITLVYGTGTNCATSQGTLTGTYNLTAQVGLTKGSGLGPILIAPAGNAVCVVTTQAVGMAGSMALTRGP